VNRFADIRSFEGTQARAWEELNYQLRPAPNAGHVETRKTRAPDGGVEWYEVYEDGHEEGFQAKFNPSLEDALGSMRKSVETVAALRPNMTRLTFVVPYDFTDNPNPLRKTDQKRWDDAVNNWRTDIAGASRLTFAVIRAGDVLDVLSEERHAGRRMFWLGELELTDRWFEDRWHEARVVVGERYTPEAHTPSHIEGDIAATILSTRYVERLREIALATIAMTEDDTGMWGPHKDDVALHLSDLRDWLVANVGGPEDAEGYVRIARLNTFDPSQIATPARSLLSIVDQRRDASAPFSEISRALDRLRESLLALLDMTSGRRRSPGATRLLAVSGAAGQGKTHLLLHTARRLLDQSGAAIVLPGIRFGSGAWWTAMSGLLGGVSATSDQFLAALDSLAEAKGQRSAIIIDALNESQSPEGWNAELPALIGALARYPNVALIVSIRSDYRALISLGPEFSIVHHPGFAGSEAEALANYCALFKISIPATSIFDPAFGNPLFLRMYCEVRSSAKNADSSELSRSNLFNKFTEARGQLVLKSLRLDPAADVVDRAVTVVADLLIGNSGLPIARPVCESAINALLPERNDWPLTLFGVMLSEGLLETSPAVASAGEVVGLPFQAYSEHVIVSRFLDELESAHAQLPRRCGFLRLQRKPPMIEYVATGIASQRRFWRAAASILPERYGHELIDVLPMEVRDSALEMVTRDSLADRPAEAFGERAFELLEQMLECAVPIDAIELMLELAPRVHHPANARWLHRRLRAQPMPDRDAGWGIAVFDIEDESAALHRMLNWIDSGAQHADTESAMLVGISLMWLLSSPNRFLRDRATKALVELFRPRLTALSELLALAQEADDPYVQERAITVAYGAVMRGGNADIDGVARVTSTLLDWSRLGLPINDLARDSARGIVAWAHAKSIIDPDTYAKFLPPYGSAAPIEPPSREELEALHGWDYEGLGQDAPWRAQSILMSCLDWLGDFNKYVVKGDVGAFSRHPLSGPPPVSDSDVFSTPNDDELLDEIDWESEDLDQRVEEDPLGEVDADWAGRWIAAQAIDYGWTPARFQAFERSGSLSGDSPHKAERFGKKYQWIALHELLARLADNFYPSLKPWNDGVTAYEGPWDWYGRDIDPSLPTMLDPLEARTSQVVSSNSAAWVVPKSPAMDPSMPGGDWVARTDDLPTVEELFLPHDPEGQIHVALQRFSEWHRRDSRRRITNRRVRDQFLLQFSWLVPLGSGDAALEAIAEERLKGRWLDGAHKQRQQYFGEGAWAPISTTLQVPDTPIQLLSKGIRVLPTTEEYHWEGVSYDCSVDENLNFHTPTSQLLGGARWSGDEAAWLDGERVICRTFRSRDPAGLDHDAVLADYDWLNRRLADLNVELILGTLGEKRAAASDDTTAGRAMSWSDITYVGLLTPEGRTRFLGPSLQVQKIV
jgi:hypothetical protein